MALDVSGWSNPRSGRFNPGKETRYQLYRRQGGPQGRSGRLRKISPPPGFDPQTVQPVASRYTDWAIPAHRTCRIEVKTVTVSENTYKILSLCLNHCITHDSSHLEFYDLPIGKYFPTFFFECLTLSMKALCSFETSVAINQSTGRKIPTDSNLHQHRCENFKSYTRGGQIDQLPGSQFTVQLRIQSCICKTNYVRLVWWFPISVHPDIIG
jgi:hypothetical protein